MGIHNGSNYIERRPLVWVERIIRRVDDYPQRGDLAVMDDEITHKGEAG